MKTIASIAMLSLVLACGAGPEPVADEPQSAPEALTGPGVAAATDGVRIAYTVYGNGSPALVFIHGWMCDQSYWSKQIDAFAEYHQLVTIDLAGHGLSGTEREGSPMMALGTDVQAVIEKLGLHQVILIGHSMGGPVALEAARLMPERVVSVIAVDALHNADFKYDPDQKAAFASAMDEDFEVYCDRMVSSMFRDDAESALVEEIRADMCSGPPEVGIALLKQFFDYEPGPALAAVDIPVRSINADKWPTDVEVNRAYHEDFDALIIPDTGHFLMINSTQEFNARLAEVISEMIQPM